MKSIWEFAVLVLQYVLRFEKLQNEIWKQTLTLPGTNALSYREEGKKGDFHILRTCDLSALTDMFAVHRAPESRSAYAPLTDEETNAQRPELTSIGHSS